MIPGRCGNSYKWLWCFRNGVKTRQGKAREKEGGTCRCWFPWQRRNRCDAYTQFRSAVYAFNNPSLITGLPRFLEYARNSSLLTSFRRLPLAVSCWHLFLTLRDNVYSYRQVFKPSNDTLFALSCFKTGSFSKSAIYSTCYHCNERLTLERPKSASCSRKIRFQTPTNYQYILYRTTIYNKRHLFYRWGLKEEICNNTIIHWPN